MAGKPPVFKSAVAPTTPRANPISIICRRSVRQGCCPAPLISTFDQPPGSGDGFVGFARGNLFAEKESQVTHNIVQMHFQHPCDSQQNIHCRHSETALDLPHVNGVDVNPFGQFFLRQTSELAVFANTAAQELAIFFGDHDWLLSQPAHRQIAQILLAIILRLHSGRKNSRNVRNESADHSAKTNRRRSDRAWHATITVHPPGHGRKRREPWRFSTWRSTRLPCCRVQLRQ